MKGKKKSDQTYFIVFFKNNDDRKQETNTLLTIPFFLHTCKERCIPCKKHLQHSRYVLKTILFHDNWMKLQGRRNQK